MVAIVATATSATASAAAATVGAREIVQMMLMLIQQGPEGVFSDNISHARVLASGEAG